MSEIYVVGHKNPDTDSICSAIAFARLKQRLGLNEAVPCRAGKVNRETQFVLDFFGVHEPLYLPDLNLRVKDFYTKDTPRLAPDTPLYDAWHLMKDQDQKTMPVIDQFQRMKGLVTLGDLSRAYVENMGDLDFETLHIPVKNVVKTLKGSLINGAPDEELKGSVFVGAMQPSTLETMVKPGSILLIGNRHEAQEAALRLGVSAMILTGGAVLKQDLLELAKHKQIVVLQVNYDTFTAARLLPLSAPVKSIMKNNSIISFQEDDLITDVRIKMIDTRYRNYPVLDDQERVVGFISRYHLLKMNRKQVILVDHNEWGQAVDGASEAQILEVIDHHRVGGIQTGEPILFRNEPVGSTCTLVAQCYQEKGFRPDKEIAGLLLAGIISDTVLFKSPTCTPKDRELASYLEAIAQVDMREFGVQMFEAGSDLSDRSVEEMIEGDLKEFEFENLKMGIGQVSVMGIGALDPLRSEIYAALDRLCQLKKLRYLMFMVTDLLNENSELFVAGSDPEKIGEAFGRPLKQGSIFLPGVLSRKKQIVPPLSRYFLQ